jgi:hypothetical protein
MFPGVPLLSTSSLRTQGPITTVSSLAKDVCEFALSRDHAVWVPAFAATTLSLLQAHSSPTPASFAAAAIAIRRPAVAEPKRKIAKTLHRRQKRCTVADEHRDLPFDGRLQQRQFVGWVERSALPTTTSLSLKLSFRGSRSENPESIAQQPRSTMDSGFVLRTPRNDSLSGVSRSRSRSCRNARRFGSGNTSRRDFVEPIISLSSPCTRGSQRMFESGAAVWRCDHV